MIERIIGATIVPAIQALTWADQIGYLVKPWTKSVETKDGFKDIVYPVARYVTTEDCQVQDYGLNVLTTDKGYTSLILISAVGDMTSVIADNIAQRRGINIEQDIKISVWINNHQGSTHTAKGELMRTLYNAVYRQVEIEWPDIGAAQAGYEMYVNKLKVSFVSESNGSPFNEYTFSKDQAQFNNNYSAFEMVFKLTGLVFPLCLPEYPELEADLCETPTNTPQVDPDPSNTPGIYTPTVTIISGVDTLSVTDAQYMRVGNTVTVSGAFNLQTDAVGVSAVFELSLPITSNLGATHHLAGVYSANDQVIYGGNVTGSIANNRAVFSCLGEWESGLVYSYSYTYRVII